MNLRVRLCIHLRRLACPSAKAYVIIKDLIISSDINVQWHQLRLGMLVLKGRVEESALEHESFILAVCDQKSTMAAKRMRAHLNNLKKELMKLMRLFYFPSTSHILRN